MYAIRSYYEYMKIKSIISLAAAAMLILSGCSAATDNNQNSEPSQVMASISDTEAQTIADSQNVQLQFNLNLLKELSSSQANLFYSSFSINQALSMALFGAEGETQKEIMDALGYSGLCVEDIVITSYSIHYTKLYDFRIKKAAIRFWEGRWYVVI